MTTKPLLCLVTNRHRLAEAMGTPEAASCSLLLQQVDAAVRAGIDLVQVREGDLEAGELLRLVRDAVAIAAGSATRIVVNDRVDVAIAGRAAGVHLRESSISAADVRAIAPQLLVGRSVHSVRSADAAGPVDYLIAGTVFPTSSKSGGVSPIGTTGLADIVRAASGKPVLAIGGLTSDRVGMVRGAGASGVAAIGAFIPTDSAYELRAHIKKTADALRFAFDTDSTVL